MADKKPRAWKTLSSKVILDHHLLKVTEHMIELPNKSTSLYVRHAPTDVHAVCVIAIDDRERVLVQREYSYPPNEIMWQLPGGSMLSGEDVLSAANRELAEESGYRAKRLQQLGYFYVHNRLSNKKQFVLLATQLEEYALPEDADEFIESHWMTKDELRRKIKDGSFVNINLLAALNIWFNQ